MRLPLALAAVMMVTPVWASGTLYYSGHAGQIVDVISISGIDSNNALIRTRHSRENATEFCKINNGSVTQDCIDEELTLPMNDEIRADCLRGNFTDFFGGKYHASGPVHSENGQDRLKLMDLNTGEFINHDNAHNFFTSADIFRALCPRKYYEITR